MPILQNLTRFSATSFLSLDKEGVEHLVVVASGDFDLPSPGYLAADLSARNKQTPVSVEDSYYGEPAQSSLLCEGQVAYVKTGTDVLVHGTIHSPSSHSVTMMTASISVGEVEKEIVVFGDRVWKAGVIKLAPSAPKPFTKMPLSYERAFGGQVFANEALVLEHASNPIGIGIYENESNAINKPLPNFEYPSRLIKRFSQTPNPAGFGPICRSWEPRRSLGGTYDDHWVKNRAPLWPTDFDELYFSSAPSDQRTSSHLRGGEEVRLSGFSAEGDFQFKIPSHRMLAKAQCVSETHRQLLLLDEVHFFTDEKVARLIWRGSFALGRELKNHQYTVIRELESWENDHWK